MFCCKSCTNSKIRACGMYQNFSTKMSCCHECDITIENSKHAVDVILQTTRNAKGMRDVNISHRL